MIDKEKIMEVIKNAIMYNTIEYNETDDDDYLRGYFRGKANALEEILEFIKGE